MFECAIVERFPEFVTASCASNDAIGHDKNGTQIQFTLI